MIRRWILKTASLLKNSGSRLKKGGKPIKQTNYELGQGEARERNQARK